MPRVAPRFVHRAGSLPAATIAFSGNPAMAAEITSEPLAAMSAATATMFEFLTNPLVQAARLSKRANDRHGARQAFMDARRNSCATRHRNNLAEALRGLAPQALATQENFTKALAVLQEEKPWRDPPPARP